MKIVAKGKGMRTMIEWLGTDKKRTRILLALFTAVVWLVAVLASYALVVAGMDTLAILSLVTAQFAVVIGFYMTTNAETD